MLDEVSFDVEADTICGLVGPNGAGKTSLFNCITGAYAADAGSAYLDVAAGGAPIELLRLPSHRLAGLGVARTFQSPTLDPEASALDNTLCGGHAHVRGNPLSLAFGLPSTRREEAALHARARQTLDELGLSRWSHLPAGDLPYAIQKKVELARALLSNPRVLLLDEPAGGLPQGEVDELAALLRRLRQAFGLTLLLVEHHMGLIAKLTDKVVVMVEGRVVLEGVAADVQKHPLVIEAYLGVPK